MAARTGASREGRVRAGRARALAYTKDERAAEARVRLMAHGTELRITVGTDVLTTALYRDGEAAKLAEMSTGIRQTFIWKGWALQPADEPEGELH